MRDIKFWEDKLASVSKKIWALEVKAKNWGWRLPKDGVKMKTIEGHGLNRDYFGYKIHDRRAKYLKDRLIAITITRAAVREIKRLKETKVNFYATKIKELGGTPKDCWGNAIL